MTFYDSATLATLVSQEGHEVCAALPAIHRSWKAALKTTRTAACPTGTMAFRNKSALQKQSTYENSPGELLPLILVKNIDLRIQGCSVFQYFFVLILTPKGNTKQNKTIPHQNLGFYSGTTSPVGKEII